MPDLAQVTCGKCKIPLSVKGKGCSVCREAKQHFVIPNLTEFGETGLGAMIQQQLRILRLATDRLENEMYAGMHWKDTQSKNPARWRFDPGHHKAAMELAKAATTILGEARKYEKQEAESVANLSPAEKLELIAEMVKQMPKDHQQELMNVITKQLSPPDNAEVVG